MNTLEALKTRRSCRAYTSEPVAPELIAQIIEAGTYAPPAWGANPPSSSPSRTKRCATGFSRINARVMDSEDDPFYGRPPCSWCSHARMWARTCTTAAW